LVLQAILWDVDGTLAETERDGHLVAMNAAFYELRIPWHWSEQRYGELLRIAGGYERLLFDMASQPQAPPDPDARRKLAAEIHRRKNEIYAALVESGAIPLRDGVRELMDDCSDARLPMGIVTTTSRANVAALLGANLGPAWERRFAAVVTADEAPSKKPDPQAYAMALERLGISGPEAVAIEDSPAGLEAAAAAEIAVVITRSRYFGNEPITGTLAIGPGLGSGVGWIPATAQGRDRVGLEQIRRWYDSATLPSVGQESTMATGWAGDGAVQQQIDDSIEDAIKRARAQLPSGPSLSHCEECGAEIPLARQQAVPGVRLCVACQSALDEEQSASPSLYNRRGSKDSQLR
jgi:phage/conjugal plasmid C-4 type zinc finger TraR family protein/HAD superfamily hydrolase (TIGR01509 family)